DVPMLDRRGAERVVSSPEFRRHPVAWAVLCLVFLALPFLSGDTFAQKDGTREKVAGVGVLEPRAVRSTRERGANLIEHGAPGRAAIAQITAERALADPGFFVECVLGKFSLFQETAELGGKMGHELCNY